MDERPVADVSVLIIAYRSQATIKKCLEALSRQTVRPREIFLLENGSPEGEALDPTVVGRGVDLEISDLNLGFAAGNNHLAKRARGKWLALLNPDAFAHDDWIEQLVAATERYPEIRLFGSTQYAADHPGLLDGTGDVYHATGLAYRSAYMRPVDLLPPEGEVFGPCGAATLVHSDLFAELGGFDESFFCYGEDVDLAFRARLAGHRAIQLRDAAVDHKGYASSDRRSTFATYHGVRNRLWVFLKDTPGWLLWVLAPIHAVATLCLWISAARIGQFRLFGKAIYDGLKAWPRIMEARTRIHRDRAVSTSEIAQMMCWDSRMLLSRAPFIQPYQPKP
jgi:N-acetylglucosaminyl-diphospho-decaprenol L-rhamnosyltransferase